MEKNKAQLKKLVGLEKKGIQVNGFY